MKLRTTKQPNPIVALVSGAVLLSGLFCQTAQAQTILNGTAILAVNAGVAADELTVAYLVADNSGVYTYDYTVNNPGSDPGTVASFEVGFDATSASVVPGSITGGLLREMITGSGVDWVAVITPGNNSGTLSFESDKAPVFANANANGIPNPPAPWASTNPDGNQVPVPDPPNVVPEPATAALLALTALLPPFRPKPLKKT